MRRSPALIPAHLTVGRNRHFILRRILQSQRQHCVSFFRILKEVGSRPDRIIVEGWALPALSNFKKGQSVAAGR